METFKLHKVKATNTEVNSLCICYIFSYSAQGRGPQVPECGCYSLSVFHMIFRIT